MIFRKLKAGENQKRVSRFLFNVLHENLSGLEGGNLMLGNNDSGVLRDVAGCLLAAGLDDEAAESAEIDVLSVSERIFYDFHELLNGAEDLSAVNTGRA